MDTTLNKLGHHLSKIEEGQRQLVDYKSGQSSKKVYQ